MEFQLSMIVGKRQTIQVYFLNNDIITPKQFFFNYTFMLYTTILGLIVHQSFICVKPKKNNQLSELVMEENYDMMKTFAPSLPCGVVVMSMLIFVLAVLVVFILININSPSFSNEWTWKVKLKYRNRKAKLDQHLQIRLSLISPSSRSPLLHRSVPLMSSV